MTIELLDNENIDIIDGTHENLLVLYEQYTWSPTVLKIKDFRMSGLAADIPRAGKPLKIFISSSTALDIALALHESGFIDTPGKG